MGIWIDVLNRILLDILIAILNVLGLFALTIRVLRFLIHRYHLTRDRYSLSTVQGPLENSLYKGGYGKNKDFSLLNEPCYATVAIC